MKKLVYALVLVVSVGTVMADGSGCDMNKGKAAKTVELTGTVVCTGAGEECNAEFRVANSDLKYEVCHGSKVDAKTLTSSNATYKVTGKIIKCGDGEALVIEKASKI